MTERIDLDDVDVETDDEASGNDGDWLWRDDDAEDIDGDVEGGNAADEASGGSGAGGASGGSGTSAASSGSGAGGTGGADDPGAPAATGGADASTAADDAPAGDAPAGDSQGDRVPHVPYESADSPAGIPKERGGSGGGAGPAEDRAEAPEASGPHGGGVDDMATAFTYEAVQRLADPRVAFAETNEFSDWVGLVGDVPAHAINSFLREHQLDIDFFNGSGDGPAERLAAIDEHSMFYSERMVVVGTEGEAWMAEDADWEFVALETAAGEAGWELSG